MRLVGAERVERVVGEEVLRLRAAKLRGFAVVLAERHARERLRALAQAEGRLAKPVPELLFVCVHNAGRSQMAASLDDPAGKPLAEARRIRDQLRRRVADLVAQVTAEPAAIG